MKTIRILILHLIHDHSEAWHVTDDGGEFDDSEFVERHQAAQESWEREAHYVDQDPKTTILVECK